MTIVFVFESVDLKIEFKYMYLTWGTSREELAQRGKCREKAQRVFRSWEVRIWVKRKLHLPWARRSVNVLVMDSIPGFS